MKADNVLNPDTSRGPGDEGTGAEKRDTGEKGERRVEFMRQVYTGATTIGSIRGVAEAIELDKACVRVHQLADA